MGDTYAVTGGEMRCLSHTNNAKYHSDNGSWKEEN